MKFTAVRLTAGSTVINLPVQGALPTDPYQLRGLDGLEAPGRTIFLSPTQDDSYYAGARPLERLPVIKIGLNPNWAAGQDVSDLRTALYAMLTMDDAPTTLSLMNGATEVCRTTGYIGAFENAPFSKETVVQITLECTSAYLVAPTETVVTTGIVNGSNNSITFTNPGSAKSGFIATFVMATAATAAQGVAIVLGGRTIKAMQALAVGDIITINTIPGQRAITKTTGGVTTSMLATTTVDPDWPLLLPGVNVVSIDRGSDFTGININWTSVRYTAQYWGI